MSAKIKTRQGIVRLVRNLKRRGKIVVTVNGSFDIIHPGHIDLLKQAKSKGDILIVFLNSDKSVRLYKGFLRPVNSEKARAEVLAAIKYVDYVATFDEINPKKILAEIRPDIHCNGSDWGKNCIEREVVEKYGGKIRVVKLKSGHSASALIRDKSPRAVFLDRDGVINRRTTPLYIMKPREFKFLPGVFAALGKLGKTDYRIIIVTNQAGIGKGLFTKKDLERIHSCMLEKFRGKHIRLDRIYVCPHRPEADCQCRKPKIGMLMEAMRDFKLNLSKSWMIGDHDNDIIMGREANLKTVKVDGKMERKLKLEPNFYAKNLFHAVNIILKADAGKR